MELCDAAECAMIKVIYMSNNVDFQSNTEVNAAARDDVSHAERMPIRVKELSERDRRRILMHFLALGAADRLLRFGNALPDESITRYVQHMDFARDKIFGVLDPHFQLVGVGHLAFAPRDTLPAFAKATQKESVAEFGVSVSAGARGIGAGTKLFARAAIHCRNADIDILTMHFLASNQCMIHIAQKSGMRIVRDHGESDAYLQLEPASSISVLSEAFDEQLASFDYNIKANVRAASKLFNFIKSK